MQLYGSFKQIQTIVSWTNQRERLEALEQTWYTTTALYSPRNGLQTRAVSADITTMKGQKAIARPANGTHAASKQGPCLVTRSCSNRCHPLISIIGILQNATIVIAGVSISTPKTPTSKHKGSSCNLKEQTTELRDVPDFKIQLKQLYITRLHVIKLQHMILMEWCNMTGKRRWRYLISMRLPSFGSWVRNSSSESKTEWYTKSKMSRTQVQDPCKVLVVPSWGIPVTSGTHRNINKIEHCLQTL